MKELEPKKGSKQTKIDGWVDKQLEHEVMFEFVSFSWWTVLLAYGIVFSMVMLFSEQLKIFQL